MLRAWTIKEDNTQAQVDNVSSDMETLRENPKKMLEVRNTITQWRMPWWAHQYTRHGWEKMNEPEDMSTETSQTEMYREKKKTSKKKTTEQNIQEL